jgi:hypothetical protein
MQQHHRTALLKDRIGQFHLRKVKPKLRHVPNIAAVAEQIASKLAAPSKEPAHFDLQVIDHKFRDAIASNDWQDITQRDWKWAPYLFWSKQPLPNEELFVDKYLNWLNANPLASNWRHLIFVYLRGFNHHSDCRHVYKKLSRAIRGAFQDELLAHRLQGWRKRDESFDLFSEQFSTHKAVSAYFYKAQSNRKHFADMTGLQGELSQVGYAEAVGFEMFHTNQFAQDNVIESVRSYHLTDDGNLRFPNQRVQLIQFHLAPWLTGKDSPPTSTKLDVQSWLLKRFGDPRLPKHRNDGWRGVGDRELRVVYRWLTGETLNQFFSIIDELALERQWEYRKAFWKAYYDKELLSDAWVALGPAASRFARRAFSGKLTAAQLDGATDEQSVLLMRIGDLIVAEWSHQGKCRAWKDGNKNAPKLYELSYTRSDLVRKSIHIVEHHQQDGISHQSSDTYWWQNQLSTFIYNETGVRIQERDYRI